MKLPIALVALVLFAAPALAETTEKQMLSYEACLMAIDQTESSLGVQGKILIEGAHTLQKSFATADGPVTVGCYNARLLLDD